LHWCQIFHQKKWDFFIGSAMLRSGVGGLAQAAKRAVVARGTAPVPAIVRGLSRTGASDGDVYARTGLDPGLFKGRKAVIYKPPKTATQNGKHNGQNWKIQ
jgi:hypothetical protein